MSASDLPLAKHLERAERHRTVGRALTDAGDEWAAVCCFYSAYHLIRYALRSDAVFDDPTTLSKVNPELTMAERTVERHKGRRTPPGGGREWGINELVMLLYRRLSADYERLHQASIEVRYGAGLRTAPPESLVEALDRIFELHEAGELDAATLCPRLQPGP